MVVYHDHTGPPDSRGSDEAETSITIDNIVFVALAMEQDMGGKTTTLFMKTINIRRPKQGGWMSYAGCTGSMKHMRRRALVYGHMGIGRT